MKQYCVWATLLVILLAGITPDAFAIPAFARKYDMSCNTCHQDGKGLEKAGTRADLAAMINTCIVQALQGKKLDEHSPEMESLLLYIRSLGK